MSQIIQLTDLSAPELDVYARLTDTQLRSRAEPEKGIFIAESPKVITTALNAGYIPLSFLMEARHSAGDAAPLLARCPDAPVYTGSRDLLRQLTGFALTRGVLCAMHRPALPAVEVEPQLTEKVDFETFCKSDFRAVKVKACDAVKKSEKLLRFTLDDGTGVDRQILSGIHKYYEPEELVGKTLIAIVNLPPRKMMGLESNGMLISAVHTEKGEECLHLIMVDDSIPAGAKLC